MLFCLLIKRQNITFPDNKKYGIQKYIRSKTHIYRRKNKDELKIFLCLYRDELKDTFRKG